MDVNRGAEITHTHGEKTATVSGLSPRDRAVKALEVH